MQLDMNIPKEVIPTEIFMITTVIM